ncbi:hypothetical protein ACOME3_000792, partial [Neoechinorhynchus agilis]
TPRLKTIARSDRLPREPQQLSYVLLARSNFEVAKKGAGKVSTAAERRKIAKYSNFATYLTFAPLGFKTYGLLC